jgi:hypothetical protein
MDGGPTYVERATEGTGCLPAKLERAIDCMRLIAGRIARPPLGISVICERCLHRWLFSCSVAALWWGAEARLRLCDEEVEIQESGTDVPWHGLAWGAGAAEQNRNA